VIEDYLALPEVQFIVKHWPAYFVFLCVCFLAAWLSVRERAK